MPPHSTAILWPMFALAGWTMCMLLFLAFRRVKASAMHKISPREYALGESARVPAPVIQANRNYMNLLELPMLFYVLCLIVLVMQCGTPTLMTLAWVYVALRLVHSLVHVTYNHVMHRFAVFAASNVVLTVLWMLVGIALYSRP